MSENFQKQILSNMVFVLVLKLIYTILINYFDILYIEKKLLIGKSKTWSIIEI